MRLAKYFLFNRFNGIKRRPTIISYCFVVVFSLCLFIPASAIFSANVQFIADAIIDLTGIDTTLYVVANSEYDLLAVDGSVLTVEIPDLTTDGFALKTGSNQVLHITPSGGVATLIFDGGYFSGGYLTRWTLSSDTADLQIGHIIGVPEANTWYAIKVDGTLIDHYQSNGSNEVTFTYNGGFSSKIFTIEKENPPSSGGGMPSAAYYPPTPPSPTLGNPQGGFNIFINDDDEYTNEREVALKLFAGNDSERMVISNFVDFRDTEQENYQVNRTWLLTEGDGKKIVYTKFCTQWGRCSEVVSDEIILDTTAPKIKITESKDYYGSAEDVILIAETEASAKIILHWDKKYGLIHADKQGRLTINLGKMPVGNYQLEMTPTDLVGNIGEKLIIGLTIKTTVEISETEPEAVSKKPLIEKLKPLIPKFLKPKEEDEEKPEKMIVISEKAPMAMQGKWCLLPPESIKRFVLAPLPKEIIKLAGKFPELGEILKKVGVTKITDLEKLKTVKLTLPGLTERLGLPTAKIEPGKFALPVGIPVAKLSPEIKQQIPTEIVFAKTGGEMIDFNITLTIGKKGEPQQKITTISGKPLQLMVKPDKPVKSIKGYIVFKPKKPLETSFQFLFNHLATSLIFANPVLAHPQEKLIRVEEELVLLEFEYTDPDKDGIYTAEIQAPLVEGEYEIITVMYFEDLKLSPKEIRLIMVVDPEGYVYATLPAGKLKIAGAIVSIYWLNTEIKQYEIWPAKEYQQENPQTTDNTGKYSFLVPPGTYYLRVQHPNYYVYQSEAFVIKEGSGIHMNIELKTKYWWLKIINWKIILIIIFGVLLFYHFYHDKIKEKLLRKSKKL